MTQNANPLKNYFRTAALHLKLPTGGKHWPTGTIDIPPTGEIPVLPMTAIDEIAYRTPDALFNGSAVVNVIQSCCPSIKNAWGAPSIDVTAILMAIRLASFGDEMSLGSTCPNCSTEGEYTLSLQEAMARLQIPAYDQPVNHGDLEIYFRPVLYQSQNQINIKQFEQQRIIMQVRSSELPEEEQNRVLSGALKEITKLTIEILTANIAAIRTPTALVTESEHIEEFVRNCDRKLYNRIRDHAMQLRQDSEIPPLSVTCDNCQHQYSQPVVLDPTSFFESAS
jgi:hypothetical protein